MMTRTSCPWAATALGRALTTSPSPPVRAKGAISEDTYTIWRGLVTAHCSCADRPGGQKGFSAFATDRETRYKYHPDSIVQFPCEGRSVRDKAERRLIWHPEFWPWSWREGRGSACIRSRATVPNLPFLSVASIG